MNRFGNDSTTYFNYAYSLAQFEHFIEAKYYAENALHLSPTDEGIQSLISHLSAHIEKQMWEQMKSETDQELDDHFVCASESSLTKEWITPEEDEAWADLSRAT